MKGNITNKQNKNTSYLNYGKDIQPHDFEDNETRYHLAFPFPVETPVNIDYNTDVNRFPDDR